MFFTVQQSTTAIVQRLGKFMREAGPGIQVKIPFIDRVVGRVNLRVQQLDVEIETKTEDNVFVRMVVAVQYYVLPEKVYDAFYKLDNASRQITSFVFDVVRAQVPKIKLDDVFEKKDVDMASLIKTLKNDFRRNEKIRDKLLYKTPKYGNDDDYADQIMIDLFDVFYNTVDGRKNTKICACRTTMDR